MFAVLVASLGLLLALVLGCGHPHIVIIVADDLGWNDVGYHGGEIETPHIDALAATGVVLESFYTDPSCTPTRAALMTGKSSRALGLSYNLGPSSRSGLAGSERTLGERFAAAGYRTAYVGKWHLGREGSEYHPQSQGFSHFYGFLGGSIDYGTHRGVDGRLDWQRNGEALEEEGGSTALIGDEVVGLIRSRDARPQLIVIAFNAPHMSPEAPEPAVAKDRARAEQTGASHPVPEHAAAVEGLDRHVGRVLEALRDEGIEDDTLVFFMSDNGGDFLADNRPLKGGKGTPYGGGIRVPAIVRWKGTLPGGAKSLQRAREYDMFATFESAAGLEREAPDTGLDLWPILRGGAVRPREPFFFTSHHTWSGLRFFAVLDGPLKLVTIDPPEGGSRVHQLFHIEADPGETRPVTLAREPMRRLTAMLESWEADYPAPAVQPDVRPQPSPGTAAGR